jgi:co-chaperonin GroES (HSP10)
MKALVVNFDPSGLRMLEDRLLVRLLDYGEGLLDLPETAKKETRAGIVVAKGGQYLHESGQLVNVVTPIGAVVLFAKYGDAEIAPFEGQYVVVQERNVLGIVTNPVFPNGLPEELESLLPDVRQGEDHNVIREYTDR